jgi:uncharacterized membrane protein (DUF2068 family)
MVTARHSHKYGLRTVATFEALKGIAVVALSIILLSLLHRDLDTVVDHLTEWLRLNPDSRIADWLYALAERTTGKHIWIAAAIGFVYSAGRFIESYGLWHEREWAEWFAVIAGAVYLPYEIYALMRHANWIKAGVLLGNIGVVFYIVWILLESRRDRARERAAAKANFSGQEKPAPPRAS